MGGAGEKWEGQVGMEGAGDEWAGQVGVRGRGRWGVSSVSANNTPTGLTKQSLKQSLEIEMALKTQFPSCLEQCHPKEPLGRLFHLCTYFMNTYCLVNKQRNAT